MNKKIVIANSLGREYGKRKVKLNFIRYGVAFTVRRPNSFNDIKRYTP